MIVLANGKNIVDNGDIPVELKITPSVICNEIEALIRKTMQDLNRNGAVVGLSGGLDSAVAAALAIRSLGKENVKLVNMPERDSKRVHRQHARKLARHFGIKLKTIRLTPVLRKAGTYKLLPLRFIPTKKLRSLVVKFGKSRLSQDEQNELLLNRFKSKSNPWIVKGRAYSYAKHRIRMVTLYQFAEVRNLLVVGAANKTEWITGTYSKWGVDHCADVMPLIHIYRSQLEQLVEHLQIPEYIYTKTADPDVMPGISDKGSLLNSFKIADQILIRLENGYNKEKLVQEFGFDNVERIMLLKDHSNHMRESPYHN
ncbi:MAG: NAD(+) synthase [Asgard group archaeon]|nr:NAD(+) synthase [Asgard group archaeon]